MEQRQPNDLDIFELTRGELNILLQIIGKQSYSEVSNVMKVLTTRPPARVVPTTEELAAQAPNSEAAADMAEASSPSEEEMGTEQ